MSTGWGSLGRFSIWNLKIHSVLVEQCRATSSTGHPYKSVWSFDARFSLQSPPSGDWFPQTPARICHFICRWVECHGESRDGLFQRKRASLWNRASVNDLLSIVDKRIKLKHNLVMYVSHAWRFLHFLTSLSRWNNAADFLSPLADIPPSSYIINLLFMTLYRWNRLLTRSVTVTPCSNFSQNIFFYLISYRLSWLSLSLSRRIWYFTCYIYNRLDWIIQGALAGLPDYTYWHRTQLIR